MQKLASLELQMRHGEDAPAPVIRIRRPGTGVGVCPPQAQCAVAPCARQAQLAVAEETHEHSKWIEDDPVVRYELTRHDWRSGAE
jgi:hypothetical protein